MNPENIQSLQANGLHILFKSGFLLLVIMFFLFLLVVYKQIRSMNKILTQPDLFPYLELFTFFLIAAVVVLFIVGVAIL